MMRESGDCKMIDIKNEEDARKFEAKISEYMKKEKAKAFANGVPWSYESDDGQGMIREQADGRKEFIPFD
tara:strand:- start:316 stop:525 length:210 start_codon:yes stop_codon:yes gene_type:complete